MTSSPKEAPNWYRSPDGLHSGAVQTLIWLLLLAEVVLHWSLLPNLETHRFLALGSLSEVLIWVLLAVLMVGVQRRPVTTRIHVLLTAGLFLWLVSATADLMDELVRQPIWVSVYVEDLPRVVGMLLVALGLLSLVRHASDVMGELQRLSLREPLTGLGNRRLFDRVVTAMSVDGFSLLMLDLDHFKQVNDRHGHDIGDQVLRRVADALAAACPETGGVYRMGGEEFAMVCEPMEPDQLQAFADQVCVRIAALKMPRDLEVTISIGACTSTSRDEMPEMVRRADQALYRAKESGRNRALLA